jgi:hypothetical protein
MDDMLLSEVGLVELIEMIKGAKYGSVDHHFLTAEHKKRMFAISYDDGEPLFANEVN